MEAAREQGTTIVLVEQSVNVALRSLETAVFLEKGEVRFHGPAADLLDRPDVLRSVFLEGAVAGFGSAATAVAGPAPSDRRRPHGAAPSSALETRLGELRRHPRRRPASASTSPPGEILGIIGPNGAGKTTLFDLISGFLRPDAGRVFARRRRRRPAATPPGGPACGLGRSFQDARLFPSITVAETIAVACERWVGVRDPVSAALHLPDVYDAERRVAARVDELLDLLRLGRFRSKPSCTSSPPAPAGSSTSPACSPTDRSVILLDEPSSGHRPAGDRGPRPAPPPHPGRASGRASLVIEHDMPLLRSVVDRLIAMDQGTVIADGPTAEVLHHPAVVASYLGTTDPDTKQSAATGGPIR